MQKIEKEQKAMERFNLHIIPGISGDMAIWPTLECKLNVSQETSRKMNVDWSPKQAPCTHVIKKWQNLVGHDHITITDTLVRVC